MANLPKEKSKGYTTLLHSLTLAHAKGPSQKESTLPTIHCERTVLIFRGVWHDDILTVAGLAILIRRMANKSRVVKTAGFQPSKCDNFQAIYSTGFVRTTFPWKKTSDFTGCMSCNITVRSVSHLCAMFLQSSQQNDDSLDWTDLRRHQGLNELMLLQSTRFKHAETSSKQHISMVWNSKKMVIASL